MSKERHIVIVWGFDGEIWKNLVTGKTVKPRCFKIVKLTCDLQSNKTSWMTASILEEWLNGFNAKMKKGKRKLLLFLDSATCHSRITITNVKLAWFPPNTTTVLQLMHMGIFYTFKCCYRCYLMQCLIVNIEEVDSCYNLARSGSTLDAVNWIRLGRQKEKP